MTPLQKIKELQAMQDEKEDTDKKLKTAIPPDIKKKIRELSERKRSLAQQMSRKIKELI